MEQIFAPAQATLATFLFALLRCGGFVLSAPVFGNAAVTRNFKAGATAWMAIIVTASMEPFSRELSSVLELILIGTGEVVIGLSIGLIAQVFFTAISLAGEVIGQQSGFAIASVLDPTTNRDTALMAQVHSLLGVLVFLTIGGHRIMITQLVKSFDLLNPGAVMTVGISKAFFEKALYTVPYLFELGFKMAGPIAVTMILVSTSEAVLAKTVPQVNILMIGFGTRILMGTFILYSAHPFIFNVFSRFISDDYVHISTRLLRILAPG